MNMKASRMARMVAALLFLLMLGVLLPASAFAEDEMAMDDAGLEAHTVTYQVMGGTWEDGTTEDKAETVLNGSNPVEVPTGMIASPGCTGGTWDTNPGTATITEDTSFTFSFDGEVVPGATRDASNALINDIPASDGYYV